MVRLLSLNCVVVGKRRDSAETVRGIQFCVAGRRLRLFGANKLTTRRKVIPGNWLSILANGPSRLGRNQRPAAERIAPYGPRLNQGSEQPSAQKRPVLPVPDPQCYNQTVLIRQLVSTPTQRRTNSSRL